MAAIRNSLSSYARLFPKNCQYFGTAAAAATPICAVGTARQIPYEREPIPAPEGAQRSEDFYNMMNQRRTIRDFSNEPVPLELIQNAIKTAGTSPSGAHKQPWTFVVVTNQKTKETIRAATEEVEKANYGIGYDQPRMGPQWLKDLESIGTGWEKPHITEASAIIVVFKQMYTFGEDGKKKGNYYQSESVGIASGFLIAALHNAGVATLTHTPTPMNYLRKLLRRPVNEKAILLLPVGYPADHAVVPDFERKPLDDIMILDPEIDLSVEIEVAEKQAHGTE